MSAFDAWVSRARNVPIEREIERRGIRLTGKNDRSGPCPKCGGTDRFAINVKKCAWNCRGCGVGGNVIKLVEYLDDVDFIGACTTLTGELPPKPNGKGPRAANAKKVVAAAFEYHNEDGTLAFVVERVEYQNADGTFVITKDGKRKKTFRQKRPDHDHPGEWLWNVEGVPALAYQLPELIKAVVIGCAILIVEGEAKADLLRTWQIPATCCACGAKKWRAEHAAHLRSANVVILPDNDDAGREHMNVVANSLRGIAASIRVLELPDLPPKGDIIDWAASGGTVERLHNLIEDAPHWLPPVGETAEVAGADAQSDKDQAKKNEDKLIEALAKLRPGVEFARQRKRAAKQLGVAAADIDAELEARRDDKILAPLYGHWIVEPWPEPVEGDSLLRDIVRRLRRHVVCAHDDALAIALWVMFSWVHESVAVHSPILNINSAQPESGKSTALGLISFLVPRCISSVEISEAALYRAIKLWQPSFAIDEFDSVLASDDSTGLRSVINSGHTRGQGVVRCVGRDEKTPELFPTFCPKAIGMCGRKMPETTLSRCIFVELRRKKATEGVTRFTHQDDAELADLRRRLARWAADSEDALRTAAPKMPAEFSNRRGDNWRVLFAIADLAGEEWGDKARSAARRIEQAADTSTIGVQLLVDIRRMFNEQGCDCMLSAVLVDRLKEDEEQPWAAWGKGDKGLTQNSLATLLGGGGGRGRCSRGGFRHQARDGPSVARRPWARLQAQRL